MYIPKYETCWLYTEKVRVDSSLPDGAEVHRYATVYVDGNEVYTVEDLYAYNITSTVKDSDGTVYTKGAFIESDTDNENDWMNVYVYHEVIVG